jgi:hypothetical protein
MSEVLLQMFPLILGSALLPIWIIIVLMLLSGDNGLAKGAAFVAGATSARLVQGVLFGLVFSKDAATQTDAGASVLVSTLLLVLGIALLIAAYKQWSHEPDPDAPPPKLLASLAGLSPLKSFGLGALLVAVAAKLWVFTLGAIATIGAADLGRTESIVAYLLYVFFAELLVILPVVAYAVAPKQAASKFGAMREWLERNNRVIAIVVSLVFGLLFLWKGLSGLTS